MCKWPDERRASEQVCRRMRLLKNGTFRGVFLDRDGTINEEVSYLSRVAQLRLIDGAAEAIRTLKQAGFKVIVVTNQAGIARGYFSERKLQQIHTYLQQMLSARNATVDAIYYCPHHPQCGVHPYRVCCTCRKPRPGMLQLAAREFDIDLSQSVVVGDKTTDLQSGFAVHSRGVLVRTGYGRQSEQELRMQHIQPDYVADHLLDAAQWITKHHD